MLYRVTVTAKVCKQYAQLGQIINSFPQKDTNLYLITASISNNPIRHKLI
jgi:hypothetical protein